MFIYIIIKVTFLTLKNYSLAPQIFGKVAMYPQVYTSPNLETENV